MNSETENPIDASPRPDGSTSAAPSFDPADRSLTEDLALAMLKNRDLPAENVEQIAQNAALLKSRKVRLAVVAHPRAPRHVALRLIRELYTFDLMQVSLLPAVPTDLKRIAEERLIARLSSVTPGERLSLARRSSALVAAALLLDQESPVWQTALDNPRLTEVAIVKALQRPNAGAAFVEAVCRHPKWSPRHEVRIALLRNPHTPLARALEFARRLPPAQLRDILHASRLPEKIKTQLREELTTRKGRS
jgi:hypothetical protein